MILKIILYVLFSSFGLVLLKMGVKHNFNILFAQYAISIQINYILILGAVFYIASFIMSLLIMKELNISIFYPVSVGLVYVLVCFLSRFLLNEKMGISQMVGIVIVLFGIIIMNLNFHK
jgi:Membrane transporters of cations and cationic drugs